MGSEAAGAHKRAHISPLRRLLDEAAKFGVVGIINAILDFGIFNILRGTVLHSHPLTANAISLSIATVSAYFMNRHWSFKHRERSVVRREFFLFFGINGIAFLIGTGVLAISRYGLDQSSAAADNAAKLIGLGIGTIFRFWTYRSFVWPEAVVLEKMHEHDHAHGEDCSHDDKA